MYIIRKEQTMDLHVPLFLYHPNFVEYLHYIAEDEYAYLFRIQTV